MPRRTRKPLLSTLIIVGEGPVEKAFLSYLKELYSQNTGQKVKVDAADGGSPENIVRTTIGKTKHADYDRKFILMDSDIEVSAKVHAMARKAGIEIIQSEPHCLEGMLLNLLGQKVPATSQKCKDLLHPMLSGPATSKDSYKSLITKQLLDASSIPQINELIRIMKKE